MKTLILILGLALPLAASARSPKMYFAPIACKGKDGGRLVLKPNRCTFANHRMVLPCYDLVLDEALSSGYVGGIGREEDGMRMSLTWDRDKSRETGRDVVSEWDGSTGVTVELPPGAISGRIPAGKAFRGKVTVIYHDIARDEQVHRLTCSVPRE